MNNRISWLLLSIGIGLCALASFLQAPSSAHASAGQKPFIALYGNGPAIDLLVQPYEQSHSLKMLREYPNPLDYLHEGNIGVPPNAPSLELRMYHVTTDTAAVGVVVQDVIDDALLVQNVGTIYPDFEFLSYIPGEFIIHGTCQDVVALTNAFDPDVVFDGEIQLDYAGAQLNQCVRLLAITNPAKRVSDFIAANAGARSEPNYVTTGFMGAWGIMGSPAAIVPDAPMTSTSGTTPLETTGESVGVYIFDTSPYVDPLPVAVRSVKGKPIRVALPTATKVKLPSELPRLPGSTVSGHGTFVATPIVDLAPNSDISLVQVLNDNGHGSQFDLALAVDWAIRDAFSSSSGADWNGVVFNYSLGLEDLAPNFAKTAMYRMVTTANALNIVQVAAAGNESAYETMPLDANLPAIHPDVIGVTAIVPGNTIACYANASGVGNVAARGGGAPRGVDLCDVDVFVKECRLLGNEGCLHGWDPNSPTNFSYGIGTSFAAPHVAAFAAQVIEFEAGGARGGWANPTQVRDLVTSLVEQTDPEEGLGDGILGAWEATTAPTAVGLGQFYATPYAPIMLTIGVVILSLGAALAWRGKGKRG